MLFFFWLFYLRFCAYLGSKRIIGTFSGLACGLVFGIFGILLILSSRRLNDHQTDAMLIEKYKGGQ